MSPKREILAELTSQELRANVDLYDLEVGDRRVKDQLVDALARSRKVKIKGVLLNLSSKRRRIVAQAVAANGSDGVNVAHSSGSGGGGGKTPKKSRNVEPPYRKRRRPKPSDGPSTILSVARLKQHLWSAADILRGSIDSSDYKSYIFALLFLKRLSDRFEEEAEKLLEEGLPEDVAWSDPDEHQFFVPDRARWRTIQKTATNLGETLNKACVALEDSNRILEGVLEGTNFNDDRKLGDSRNRDTVLARLVQRFSELSLRNDRMAEPDMLGRAYEYLIEQFADDAGKKGGEFYTPRMVVKLIVEILAPTERMRICDPTVGSGGMLIECANYVKRNGGNPRNLSLDGQEKNLSTWAICKMNMLLHGLPDARIEKGDTIRNPRLIEDGNLILYDRVIANPPFSLDEWGREVAESDGFGRFRFGIPPGTKGDLAFVQHMIAALNADGRLGIVMPHGVLFRGGSEGTIRAGLLREDKIEAVISLAPNLFYGTAISTAILVFNSHKLATRRGKVLFIEASREFQKGTSQNFLRDHDVERIAKSFHNFVDLKNYARVVSLHEIMQNNWNLNVSRYVDTSADEEQIDVARATKKLRDLERERKTAESRMNRYLEKLGYAP